MGDLLRRLLGGVGEGLEKIGASRMEEQRQMRVSKMKDKYAVKAEARRLKREDDAATSRATSEKKKLLESRTYKEGETIEKEKRDKTRDERLIISREESQIRVAKAKRELEGDDTSALAKQTSATNLAEEVVDEADSEKWFEAEEWTKDQRWKGDEDLFKADLQDKALKGWSKFDLKKYVLDPTYAPDGAEVSKSTAPKDPTALTESDLNLRLDAVLSSRQAKSSSKKEVLDTILANPRMRSLHAVARARLSAL